VHLNPLYQHRETASAIALEVQAAGISCGYMWQLQPAQHNILHMRTAQTVVGLLGCLCSGWVPRLRPIKRTSACRVGRSCRTAACCPFHLTFSTGSCGPVVQEGGTYRVSESCSVRALYRCLHPMRFLLADTKLAGRQENTSGFCRKDSNINDPCSMAVHPQTALMSVDTPEQNGKTHLGASCICSKA
jgi:hypothetical protein